jgi:hypothetical protein
MDRLGSLEFKKPKMPASASGAVIEVELAVGSRVQSVIGRGRFDVDADLGRVLRILVADKPGNFELLIPEANWKGIFQLSSMTGCEYKVSLVNGLACSN